MPTSTVTVREGDAAAAQQIAQQAAAVLAGGGLVIFPTETVYGVAASAADSQALAALRHLKDRPDAQPFTVHLPDPAAAQHYVDLSDRKLKRFLEKVLPGPVSLVVEVTDQVIADRIEHLGWPPEARERLYHDNTIGLRCPDHSLALAILGAVDTPVLVSSANRHGRRPPQDAEAAAAEIGAQVDLIVDGGRCRYAKASTVVKVSGHGPRQSISILRAGVYDERVIRKLLRWTALFVCSGNTCRSPIAAALARSILAGRLEVAEGDLEAAGRHVVSAGAFAVAGSRASEEAVEAMKRQGIDLAPHRSQRLTSQLIHEADVVWCMTDWHRQTVIEMVPSAAARTHLLDPNGEIADPIGSGLETYEHCATAIRGHLEQQLTIDQP